MALATFSLILCVLITFCGQNFGPSHASAKVYMVVMEDEPVISYKSNQKHVIRGEEAQMYKEKMARKHGLFLDSFLPAGSYTKIYSYTHLLNGFALHTESEEAVKILSGARGVRLIQEDIKMAKMTMYTPKYIGANVAWPRFGGGENAGDKVVIGMIDTGINPKSPSFSRTSPLQARPLTNFRGRCQTGDRFPPGSCNGKIVGAMFFSRAAEAAGEFNATVHCASPYDPDGHGSHTASIAAGNFHTATNSKGYNFGYASGVAPGARLAIYKAAYSFGGYMSDVVAAVDQAVADGVDIISLSIAPSSVPPGPASYLNVLETQLLSATKAGVSVVQAVGNGGPDANSVVSFSPWIMSVAASITDRKYNNSFIIGNGRVFSGNGLSAPTPDEAFYPLALADDVSVGSASNCQDPKPFIKSLVQGKLILCSIVAQNYYESVSIASIFDTVQKIGATGVIITSDRDLDDLDIGNEPAFPTEFPAFIVQSGADSQAVLDYYNNGTVRGNDNGVTYFGAIGRILDGRHAVYTNEAPVIAAYSSRGPDVDNNLMETADVLKPNIAAPGNLIWGAWSPTSDAIPEIKGEEYAMLSGTSMAAPHIAGVAALIKQSYPKWSPAAIMSAIMTTADVTDHSGRRLLAERQVGTLEAGTPFDYGAGAINATRAMDPGLVFDVRHKDYLQFLCAVPGVDDGVMRRIVGESCPKKRMKWCSDLNTPSITVASLVGSRQVDRKVTSVGTKNETYMVHVQAPYGVSVDVSPDMFRIGLGEKKVLRITLKSTVPGSGFSFGEVLLKGDMEHNVRIPLAVYPSAILDP